MTYCNVTRCDSLSSVSDSIHSHGCPRLPGVLRVQGHMDEVRVWGGQRLQQVRDQEVDVGLLKMSFHSLHLHFTYSKLRINVDITVAMRCQCKYRQMHVLVVVQLWKSTYSSFKLCVCLDADIGADVLDLAETMVASDGLIYEAVSCELLQWTIASFYTVL